MTVNVYRHICCHPECLQTHLLSPRMSTDTSNVYRHICCHQECLQTHLLSPRMSTDTSVVP
ncbi:uncharacterized protein [Haliotis cracherodii]|uniref:uncharacterized protein n=1 Tax=Haliotis cracherodii TaxID=6455 RepID=UPI0039EC655C